MYKERLKDFKNIGIIQTAFIGDTALSLYLCQTIRNYHPECKLTFISTPVSAPLTASAKAIDSVITYDKRGLQSGLRGLRFIAESIKEKEIECLIVPHRSYRSAVLSFLSKPDYSVSFNKSSFSILYNRRVKYQKFSHERERNHDLLKAFSDFGDIAAAGEVELDISDEDKSFIESKLHWLNADEKANVLIAPGSVWETKKWKEHHFISLINLLMSKNCNVLLTGSEKDKEICSRIAASSGAVNLAGETSLPQTIYLMQNCSLTITNDSAPTHLAGIAKCPCITLYGPTSPIFGFGPLGEGSIALEVNGLKCKPCAIHGSNKCPKKTHECMESLSPDMVFEHVVKILNL